MHSNILLFVSKFQHMFALYIHPQFTIPIPCCGLEPASHETRLLFGIASDYFYLFLILNTSILFFGWARETNS